MKNLLTKLSLFLGFVSFAQTNYNINTYQLNQDFGKIIQDLSDNYIYLSDKKTDFNCVKKTYANVLNKVKTSDEKILFFEYLLSEFYDNQLVLNVKTRKSFRLHSPVYVKLIGNQFYIQDMWFSQVKDFGENIIGAQVLNYNSKEINKLVDNFPVNCVNKKLPEVREWIANKIISGRFSESRILTLRLKDNRKISLNLNNIKIEQEKELLSISKKGEIGIIKINNSLNNPNLVRAFDAELNTLLDTKGLILDLRNTVSGGNEYVVRSILSRFVANALPYQKHTSTEKFGNNPEIVKSSLAYVVPRGIQYEKPIIVLVGRWTSDAAEALTIGLDGMKRAKIVGTEMGKFAGSVKNFNLINSKFGYQITTTKLHHINGTLRENFIPKYNISQLTTHKDYVLDKAFDLLKMNSNERFVDEINTRTSVVSKLE